MKPENVNPGNFNVDCILFNNADFSIAYGTWEDNEKYLAMRWNGEDGELGYPKVFTHPMWFMVDRSLILPILQSLIGQTNVDNEKLLRILAEVVGE